MMMCIAVKLEGVVQQCVLLAEILLILVESFEYEQPEHLSGEHIYQCRHSVDKAQDILP